MSMLAGSLLIMAGFETKSLDSYRTAGSSSGCTIESTGGALTGTYYLKAAAQEYINVPLAGGTRSGAAISINNFGVTFGFRMDDQDTSEHPSVFSPGAATWPWIQIGVSGGNRKLQLVNGSNYSTQTVVWTGTYTLALDTWYVISVCGYMQGSTSTTYVPYRIKLFNSTGATLHEDSGWQAAVNTHSTASAINSMYFGQGPADAGSTSGTHNFHYDDIMICESSPAPIAKIVGSVPTGDSATAADDGFFGEDGVGTTWDNVDEIPPDDATTYATSRNTSGTSTSVTDTTMTDTGKTWVVNEWTGFVVTSGGKTMTVTSNTATVLTGTGGWSGGGNPGTGTYAMGGTSSVQLFTHAAIADPAATGNVLAVCAYTRHARDAASGTTSGRVRMKTSSGNLTPGGGVASSSDTTWVVAKGCSPVSTAGAGWVKGGGGEADIDVLEFGVSRTSAHLKITQALLEVAWGNDWTNTGDQRFFPDKKNYIMGAY